MDPDREMAAAMGFSSFGSQPQSHSRKRQKLSTATSTPDDHRRNETAAKIIVPTTTAVLDPQEAKATDDDADALLSQPAAREDVASVVHHDNGSAGMDGREEEKFPSDEGPADNGLSTQTLQAPSTSPTPSMPTIMAPNSNPSESSHGQPSGNSTIAFPGTHQGHVNSLPSRPQQARHHHQQNNTRNGVWQGDEGGYYDESFIEDPWRALRS